MAELKADEETEEQFEVIVKDEGKAAPGVYHLYFNLARPGPYKLHVLLENKLSHVREDIPGSPHAITLD